MKLTPLRIRKFQEKIFSWWEEHRRRLPWRETSDPYFILVSEVMLQQTQVSRVLPKYDEFLYHFPDVYALAHASVARVLKAWRGMGYNRRALYLKKTAEAVVKNHHGYFPDTEAALVRLPGIGIYTARAVMVFAYRKDVAMVDTNIRQIITHFFFDGKAQKESTIAHIADMLVPKGKSWEWHQALMDYGSLELSKIKTKSPYIKKQVVPFRESNRYFRGRIIDALREKSWRESLLVAHMGEFYQKPNTFINEIIRGLVKDELVERRGSLLRLPE